MSKTDKARLLLKQIKEQSKQDIKNEIQNMKDSVNELKNLFKF